MVAYPEFAGISMRTQSRRRQLVLVTYFVLAAVLLLVALLGPQTVIQNGAVWAIIVFSGISRGVFGNLVKQTTFPEPKPAVEPGLGLSPTNPFADPLPDEREVSVRNLAYFQAFRVMAVYAIILWGTIWFMAAAKLQFVAALALVTSVPLVVIAFTLPQAIILWTEPDLPEPE